jgi:energy-coupling factor transport system permease protein
MAQERLSFYVRRESLLHALNPLTKLLLTFTLLVMAFFSPWYWTALVLVLFVILPLSILGKVMGPYLSLAGRLILPAVSFIFVMQSLFLPGGEQVLLQFWIFEVTAESLSAAFLATTRISAMVSSFVLFLLTTHPSQLMSDLTRRKLPPTFSYVIISTLQIIPQMQAKAQTIMDAQRSRGLDTESSFMRRVRALVPLVGPLVFGSLVEVEERAIAIEARGFTAPHVKTALHEIPDTRLDRRLRWGLLTLILFTFASKIWLS